ncbi:hypothetical protein [Alcanivorax sp. 24]|uniref:hypothetical protein n=1 Tax=Alcanivorax sp. 24 TaxID=2545266 RepID=UPI00196B2954|nr:hypothetical protein [Alcanivorax sp. 24]
MPDFVRLAVLNRRDVVLPGFIQKQPAVDLVQTANEKTRTAKQGGPNPADVSPDWLIGAHPLFEDLLLPVGLARHRVTAETALPRVAIAMVGGDGRAGLLGRGLCVPPAALFVD